MDTIKLSLRPLSLALRAAFALSVGCTLLSGAAQAQQRVISFAGLNGQNGFRLDGVTVDDQSGAAVTGIADINGDGRDDLLIGATGRGNSGGFFFFKPGRSYVVFGRASGSFPSILNLGALNGSDGFRLDGVTDGDGVGGAVSTAGDLNGDGLNDLAIGASGADSNGTDSGSSYVVYGRSGAFPAVISLNALNGNDGFRIDGATAGDRAGSGLSMGDFNGDGRSDLIVSAADAESTELSFGSSYVLFGRSNGGFPAVFNLASLNGANGFRVDGAMGNIGVFPASNAGDVNGDGIDDMALSAPFATPDPSGMIHVSGSSYVLFGKSTAFAPVFSLWNLDGSNGFRMDGVGHLDFSGQPATGAGDVNGDGFDDLAIGTPSANPNGEDSGSTYIVFGRSAAFPPSFSLGELNGSNGFRIDGVAAGDRSGSTVASAGDFNGDGFDDVVIGAMFADTNGGNAGSGHVVFGRSAGTFPATLGLGTITGAEGLRFDGEGGDQHLGTAIADAGDVNDDGVSDLIIGAYRAQPNGFESGSSYVIFGNHAPLRDGPATITLPAILEDAAAPSAASVRSIINGVYLDVQPLVGVGIDQSTGSTHGTWQYAFSGSPVTPVPAALSATNALVIGASVSGANAGTLRHVPAANYFGDSEPLLLRMWDGSGRAPDSPPNIGIGTGQSIAHYIGSLGGFSNDANRVGVIQPVLPVNDAPDFSASNPAAVGNNAGVVQIPGWATFSPGPGNESDQIAVQYLVSDISDPQLFAAGFAPRVIVEGNSGMLQFAPINNTVTSGSSTFRVRVRDSGGTANGGIDTSVAQTFTINVNPVNDAPSFNAQNPPAVAEDNGPQSATVATAISAGPADEAAQALTFAITGNSNAALFSGTPTISSAGVLSYTPAADANGSAVLSLRLQDSGGIAHGGVDTSATQTITVAINSVNDAPSFFAGPNQGIAEDAGAQTFNPWATAISAGPADEATQTLAFTMVSNDNAELFSVQPSVSPAGVLTFTAAANANGSANLSLRVSDSGGTADGGIDTSAVQNFSITVNTVNDAPSFTASDPAAVGNNAGVVQMPGWTAFSPGPGNESAQNAVEYTVSNISHPELFASGFAPTVTVESGGAGMLQFAPVDSGTFGTSTFTVRVRDSGGTANGGVDLSASQTFTITIMPTAPMIFDNGFE
jgi:hypothetical protein